MSGMMLFLCAIGFVATGALVSIASDISAIKTKHFRIKDD